jgi:cobalt-zinc-cadmium efflux system membrane fusion protein
MNTGALDRWHTHELPLPHQRERVGVRGLFMAACLLLPAAAHAQQTQALGCLIEPSRVADVGSPVVGVLEQVLVERGDKVTRGQVLAILRAGVERAQVDLAQSRAGADADLRAATKAHEFAQKKRDRMQGLFNQEFISSQALDQAVAEAQVAEARLRQAREQTRHSRKELQLADAQLDLRTIRSPIDGIVVERFRDDGERVEDKPILKIALVDPLRVEAVLPAALYGRVQPGQAATVQPDLAALAPVQGTVSLVDRVIDPASNTFRARLELPNPEGRVPAGLRCKLQLPAAAAPAAEARPARPATAGMSYTLSRPQPRPAAGTVATGTVAQR